MTRPRIPIHLGHANPMNRWRTQTRIRAQTPICSNVCVRCSTRRKWSTSPFAAWKATYIDTYIRLYFDRSCRRISTLSVSCMHQLYSFTSISSSTLRIGRAAQYLDMKFTSLQAELDSMNQRNQATTTSATAHLPTPLHHSPVRTPRLVSPHHIASMCARNSCKPVYLSGTRFLFQMINKIEIKIQIH